MAASLLTVALLLSAAPPSSRDDARALTQSSVDELLAVVLDRVLTVEDYLPERGLLPANGPLLVRQEIQGSSFVVSNRALKSPERWTIRSEKALQEQADTTRKSVFFVMVNDILITKRSATLDVGVDIAFRASDDPKKVILKMCCCWATDHYERDLAGRWSFKKRDHEVCI